MSDHKPVVRFDEKKIDAIVAQFDQGHLPGVALGIAIDRKPVYRKGFGLASMELPVVLSPSIRLRTASVSKQFTCFAYLLLCEEGKAAIDDPLGKFLPELHPVTHQVTMRQLMGHTSGLRDVYAIFSRFNDPYAQYGGVAPSLTSADLLPAYKGIDDVEAAPGVTWIYNNGCYMFLSIAIERIAGQKLEDVMWERIFKPIGMYDSLLMRFDTNFIANRGTQHVVNPAGGFERLYWGVESHFGAGAVVSTIDDLLRWLAHMDVPKVGNTATWAAMKAPQTLANGMSTRYGLGLNLAPYRGVEIVSHTGNAFGGSSRVLKVPSAGLDIAMLSNRQDVWCTPFTNEILDVCLPGLAEVKKPRPRQYSTGTFRSSTSGRVIQLFGQEDQQIVSIDGIDLAFEPDDAGVLWEAAGPKVSVTLLGDPVQPEAIRCSDYGNIDDLVRVQPAAKPEGRSIVGRYCCAGVDTDATISEAEDGMRLNMAGRFGSVAYRLECISEGIWRARTVKISRVGFISGMLSFDENNQIFRFSGNQIRSLRFRRCA